MLAESGGKVDAVNINYTPQEEGKEVIPQEILNQSQEVLTESFRQVAEQSKPRFPNFETMEPSSTDFISDEEQAMYPTFKWEGTNLAGAMKKGGEWVAEKTLALDSPNWDTREFRNLKPLAQLSANMFSHLTELPGLAIDIPTQLLANPEETLVGLISFFPDEFNNLLMASNIYDVTNPIAGLVGLDVSREKLASMRKKAQKHIYNTGGVYTFMAAHGLTNLGVKTKKIAEKNAEFRDVVKDANGETPSKPLSKEGKKASDALKKNPELNEKAKQAVSEQLESDLIEPKKSENIIEKAEKQASTEVNLDRDIPNPEIPIIEKNNTIKKEVKKVTEKIEKIEKEVAAEKAKEKKAKKDKDVVQEVKIKKSTDLVGGGKRFESIKGEPAKRFKIKENLEDFISNKIQEYSGEPVIIKWGEISKGNYIVKVLKDTKEQPKEKIAVKSGQKKIGPEPEKELVTTMRDPMNSKRQIQNKDVLVEKYELEIGELNRNIELTLQEISKLEQQTLETGVVSPRIELLKNSIDSLTRTIGVSQNKIRSLMSSKQLINRMMSNIGKRTAKGQIGGNSKKSAKERIKDKLRDEQLRGDIKRLWEMAGTGLKMTKKNLIQYLREIGSPRDLIKYANKNYKRISDEALFDNYKKISNEIDKEWSSKRDPVKNTRTKYRKSDEYIGNIRLDIISGDKPNPLKQAQVDLLHNIVNSIGGEKVAGAKGTTTLSQINRDASSKKIIGDMIHEVFHTRKITIDNLPAKTKALVNMLTTLMAEYGKTGNKEYRPLIERGALSYMQIASEAFGQTGRVIKDLNAKQITDWKVFEDLFVGDASLVQILQDIMSNKEITRSRLFKLAEYGRNAKLATGSSLVRSLAGNSVSSLDAFGRMFFEFGNDYLIRKTSGALYELTNGYYGNLSKNQMNKLELGAQVSGYIQGFPEAGRLAWEMIKENDAVLRESSFFNREGLFYKDISGTKGKIIRTPQRLQGAIDILFRVPLTNAFMKKNAVRQAIKEGYKSQTEIQQRAIEILEKGELDAALRKEAINSAEYVTFQNELKSIGKDINKLRVGNTRSAAVAQMIVPFMNTATNLFKYTLEHTPLHLFSKDFRNGFREAFSAQGKGSRQMATELAKMQTGALSLYLLNRFLAENSSGNITGDWSSDEPEERNMKTVDGQLEYSFKTDNGKWISYRGFEPISSYLTLIESFQRTKDAKKLNDSELKYWGTQIKEATTALVSGFAENPFLTGTGDVIKALEDEDKAVNFLSKFLGGMFVPGFIRQAHTIVSPNRTKRLKWSEINENVDWFDYSKSQAEQVIPWLIPGNNLDALDPFGRVIPKPDPVGGLFAFRQTEPINDPVYAEIQDIYFDRDKGFRPASAFFTVSELSKLKLTPEEHHSIIAMSGQILYNYIEELMKKDAYQTMYKKGSTEIRVPSSPAYKRARINDFHDNLVPALREKLFENLRDADKQVREAEWYGEINNKEERIEYRRKMRDKFSRKTINDLKIEANELISNLPENNNLKKLGEEIPFLELAQ